MKEALITTASSAVGACLTINYDHKLNRKFLLQVLPKLIPTCFETHFEQFLEADAYGKI